MLKLSCSKFTNKKKTQTSKIMINDPFNDDDKTKRFLQQYNNNNNQISIEWH